LEAANEILFPHGGWTGKVARIKLAFQRLFANADDIDEGMRREMAAQLTQAPDLKDLGSTGEYWRKKEKAA